MHKRITVSGSQTIYVVMDATATAASGMFLYSLPIGILPNQGNIFVDTYTADSYSGGVSLGAPINLNERSSITSLSTIYKGATVSGTISNLREYSIGSPSTNQSSGGGGNIIGVPKLLNNAKPIVMKVMNQETTTVILDFNFVWFEITPYVPLV